jgi:hypothetical protein
MKIIPQIITSVAVMFVMVLSSARVVHGQASPPLVNPNDQGIGMSGTLQAPPPSDAPTISIPGDGTVFQEIPITVSGLCTDTLLVRVFKNNVFGGSAICDGGSYSIQMDLFPGLNTIVARQYDDLDQSSPESNKPQVTFAIDEPVIPGSPNQVGQRVTLTSTIARLGADPGSELSWPITLSGGRGPYAISVDWGDTKNDLLTRDAAGTFDIKHTYDKPGVYRLLIKATDADGESAFLQLVAIANGAISTAGDDLATGPTVTRTRILWQPALIAIPLIASSFWLGKRYQLKRVRYRMKHQLFPIDK